MNQSEGCTVILTVKWGGGSIHARLMNQPALVIVYSRCEPPYIIVQLAGYRL